MDYSQIIAAHHTHQGNWCLNRPSIRDIDTFYDTHSGAEWNAIARFCGAARAIATRAMWRQDRFTPTIKNA